MENSEGSFPVNDCVCDIGSRRTRAYVNELEACALDGRVVAGRVFATGKCWNVDLAVKACGCWYAVLAIAAGRGRTAGCGAAAGDGRKAEGSSTSGVGSSSKVTGKETGMVMAAALRDTEDRDSGFTREYVNFFNEGSARGVSACPDSGGLGVDWRARGRMYSLRSCMDGSRSCGIIRCGGTVKTSRLLRLL